METPVSRTFFGSLTAYSAPQPSCRAVEAVIDKETITVGKAVATRVVSVKSIYIMRFWWNYYQIIPGQHFSAAVDFF